MTNFSGDRVAAPMSCTEAVQLLWEYLDGELDEARRERVRVHLTECSHCRDQYTFEGAFLHAVDRMIDEPLDISALRVRIVKALEEKGFPPIR
jgi:anti-sigma factor (TIGR02949 family)